MSHTFSRKLSTTIWLVFTLFSVLFSNTVEAETTANKIQQDIKTFTINELDTINTLENRDNALLEIQVRKLDPRLKIPNCTDGFTYEAINFSPNASNFSVKASCLSKNWFTYVSVSLSRLQHVVVASTVISPGELISAQSLRLKKIDVNRLRTTTYIDTDKIIGTRAKKRMREGAIITSSMLCFVCKGDRITVTANASGLSLKTTGIAMEDGNLGDSIKIRNASTDKRIIGKVVRQGEVRIAF